VRRPLNVCVSARNHQRNVGKFFLSPEALEDLDVIWTYIAEDNAEAVDRVLNAAYGTCKNLADNPELGRLRKVPEITSGIHSFVITEYPNYVIFYRVLPNGVQIVRVLHGARNIEGLF
jgi:toxin ParE1/3/4